jgi:hypothetical protein
MGGAILISVNQAVWCRPGRLLKLLILIEIDWSGREDLNLRPLDPEPVLSIVEVY